MRESGGAVREWATSDRRGCPGAGGGTGERAAAGDVGGGGSCAVVRAAFARAERMARMAVAAERSLQRRWARRSQLRACSARCIRSHLEMSFLGAAALPLVFGPTLGGAASVLGGGALTAVPGASFSVAGGRASVDIMSEEAVTAWDLVGLG